MDINETNYYKFTSNNVRVGVTPLAIEHIELAENRELLVDYGKGKLWIKNNDTLFDVTDKVKEAIIKDGINIDKCTVFVSGLGNIFIGNAISQIMNSLINVTDLGTEPQQIVAGYNIDFITITNKNKKLQLVGFDKALDGTVPTKVGGKLVWTSITSSDGPGSIGISVHDVDPNNGRIQIGDNQVQHTSNLDSYQELDVSIPTSESEYFSFRWRLETSEYNLVLRFPANVGFEYRNDPEVEPNSIYVFEFETYDYGHTWLCKKTRYNQPEYLDALIDTLDDRVYTKDEVNMFLSWIDHTIDNGGSTENQTPTPDTTPTTPTDPINGDEPADDDI